MYFTESLSMRLDDLLQRICAKLEITPTQYQVAEERYRAVGSWLDAEGSRLHAFRPEIYPQGSVLIATTVRPMGRDEYDVDLVCELQFDWRRLARPELLLDAVEARMKENETYRSMIERRKRCVCLRYRGAFHLDILPACPDPASGPTCLVVPDRRLHTFVPSNPKGFAIWFEDRARALDMMLTKRLQPFPGQQPNELKPPLKRAVQLLKRWRDIYYAGIDDLAPISIVLTTLAGSFYAGQGTSAEALSGILEGVVAALPRHGRLVVMNPSNSKEDLSERWGEKPHRYEAFVDGIIALRDEWLEVMGSARLSDVSTRLEKLFGEEITKAAVRGQVELIEKARGDQVLATQRGLGTFGAATAPAFVPVRKNTFYGKE